MLQAAERGSAGQPQLEGLAKVEALFHKVLEKLAAQTKASTNSPNGTVQLIIAQIGPLMQRVEEQLMQVRQVQPDQPSSQRRYERLSRNFGPTRSQSQENASRAKILDRLTRMKQSRRQQTTDYTKFSLGLVKHVRNHFDRLSKSSEQHMYF